MRGSSTTAAVDSDESAEQPVDRAKAFTRVREAIWFEPLVAFGIIAVLLLSIFAFTSNWPPAYVVESRSMQHGYDDHPGLINTGDLVLAQKVPTGTIIPYVVAQRTGYTTYGENGDVLLYRPNDDSSTSPIIHRSILFLEFNTNGTYSAPDLNGLACGKVADALFSANSTGVHSGCSTLGIKGVLTLFHVGWQSVTVQIPLDPSTLGGALGGYSGFITMGDNNLDSGMGEPDQTFGISHLVAPGWVIGVARGMIPWFGALKLGLQGNASEVPAQSWQYMGISLTGTLLAVLGVHLIHRKQRRDREGRGPDRATGAEEPPRSLAPPAPFDRPGGTERGKS
ncbi:MAG: hypothetical protein ACHQ2Y_04770 [Candidatus Lutacidiplasmatales archaeon]